MLRMEVLLILEWVNSPSARSQTEGIEFTISDQSIENDSLEMELHLPKTRSKELERVKSSTFSTRMGVAI